jgi:hypothetical protein
MKNATYLLIISIIVVFFACGKKNESERFNLLTSHAWTSDSLLAEGIDVSGPGQLLEKFKGDAEFRKDGSGNFGKYTGTWRFAYDETSLVIDSDSLQVPLTVNIVELTKASLKVITSYPNPLNLSNPYDIRMTFKAK